MRTRLTIALAALAACALGAGPARAETVTTDAAGTVIVTAAPGEANKLGFQASAAEDGRLTVYDSRATVTSASPACQSYDSSTVTCDWNPSAGARADLGDGDDWGYVSFDLPAGARFAIAGGAGNDHLQADVQATTLDGGPGDDRLDGGTGNDALLGGDGNDQIEGRAGADAIDGGAGDDLLSGDGNAPAAGDRIEGGPGYDRIESDWSVSDYGAAQQPVAVTLGGGADDGRAGEGDDITGVEKVISHAGGKLVGTDAGEYLEAFQVSSPVQIAGNGGDDTLRGGDGADTVDGGAGNDDIDAGFGDDTITGGPGQDHIAADRATGDCGPLWCKYPYGNDTVDARDGERDSITCGFGDDTVYADAVDVVDSDCEHVIRGAASGGGGGGAHTASLRASAGSTRLARALAHGLVVRVTAPSAGRLTASAAVRGRTVGRAAKTVRRAGTTTVVLRVSRQARKRLRHARAVTFAIAVRFTARDAAPVTRKLALGVKR
jgi:Ca2+-binding RTX toxin-like protein